MNAGLTSLLAAALAGGVLTTSVLTAPVPHDPEPPVKRQRTQVKGFQRGLRAGVHLRNSSIALSGNGLVGKGLKSDGYRMPRPCWREPMMTAEELRRKRVTERKQDISLPPSERGVSNEAVEESRRKLGEKGMWWGPAANWSDPGAEACYAGLAEPIWASDGTTPAGGITAEQLLQLARAALTVPEPKIKLSPDAKSYVNLETWVWLESAQTTPRTVTATLPGVMSATVTATPQALEIKSGTTDDRAKIGKDCGTTGHPYKKGEEFRCGVQYLRASIDQPRKAYTLTVTAVWNVTGSTTGGDATALTYAPIRVSASRDVPVDEVQTIVTN
ncbi:hypothetical protein ACFHYQ_21645 [Sphaerimonospora cavernae]|uniref:Enoyl reductase n=1 Tax=Sphaerimonospora cavernae TaxID=1740611 RepID=A0ABV6U9R4_9ACTN